MKRYKARPLLRVLQERGISIKELADAVDLNVRTIHNISCGSSCSRRARRRIQRFLGVQIWNDIPLTDEVLHTFRPTTRLGFSHRGIARAWAERFNKLQPGTVSLHGRDVQYEKPITVTAELVDPKPSAKLVTRVGDTFQFNRTCKIVFDLPPKLIAAGRRIEFPTAKDACAAAASINAIVPGVASRSGRIVTCSKPLGVVTGNDNPKSNAAVRNRKPSVA